MHKTTITNSKLAAECTHTRYADAQRDEQPPKKMPPALSSGRADTPKI